MIHHMKKISSTIKASPLEILHQLRTQVLYPGPPLEISLRPFKLTDVDDIMVWATNDRVLPYWGSGGWGTYKSKEEALKEIEDDIIPHPWYRAICLKNKLIGKIFVDPYNMKNSVAELGYIVASKHWGKGIATTAVKMVLDNVFKEWPHLERLAAEVDVNNLGSQRVLEKAGFLKEGVLRKRYLHKMSRVDIASFSFLDTDLKE